MEVKAAAGAREGLALTATSTVQRFGAGSTFTNIQAASAIVCNVYLLFISD